MRKIYKTILASLVSICVANTSSAQVSAYSFTQSNGTYNAISGGSVIATATGTTAAGTLDDAVYNLPTATFPFTFTFNGVGYTGCNISTNGFITFGTTAPGTTNYTPISGAGGFAGSIAAWGGDLNSMFSAGTSSLTGEIRYEVVGTAPNREIVIQYSNWRPTFNTSTTTTNIYGMSYQIRLQETTNKITIVYGPNAYVIGATSISGTRQIGLRGATNADFNNRLNTTTTLFNSSTNGTANSSTQAYNTTVATPGMPTNGLTYEWAPPTPCSGTPNAGMAISSLTSVCTSTNVNLNLSGSTSGVTGLTYQWYSSPDGSSWSAISSATSIATTQSVTASTYYQAVVSCGINSATSTPIQIQIATTTTNTVPYFEGFEGIGAAGQLPNCSWTKTGDWTTNIGAQSNNRFPRTGTKYAHTSWSTIAGGDYIYTNGIQLNAGTTYSVSSFYVVDGASGWDEISVLYGPNQSTVGLTNINTMTALTNTVYNNLSGTFTPTASGIYYLAFKAVAPTTTPWYLSIDDISLDVAPACITPPSIGSITGPSSANINTSNQYTLTSLSGSVQWYQGNSASGPWTAISNATTTPQNITFNQSGTKFLTAIASNPGCANDTVNVPYQVQVIFPGNDICDAIPLTVGTSAPYSLFGATTQTGEVAPPNTGCSTNNGWCNSTLNNTMWFTFTAPTSGYVSIQSPGFDTQLAIWKAANCGDLLSASTATLIAANDDDANYTTNSGVQFSSYIKAACLTPGATYYIQLDSYSAAVNTETTTIIITDLGTLDASFSGLSANYCIPAASSSLVPATTGGVFTINTNTTSVTSFSATNVGVGTHTVTYSIFGCQTTSTTVVAATPSVNAIASNSAICVGNSATLTASGATNYTWTSGGNSASETVSPNTNSTYTVTGETAGCSSNATVSVNVNTLPSVSIIASSTLVCSNIGESATLTASTAASNYTWSTSENTASITVTPTVGTTYTLTVNDGLCEANTTIFVDAQVCSGLVENLAYNNVSIYPNPNNGMVTVAISSNFNANTSLEVYDALGKLVIKETLTKENTSIKTTDLKDGVYMFKVISNNNTIKVGRMIKQ